MKEVNYKININTEDANKGLKKTEASIDAIPKSIKAAEQGTDKLNKGLTKTNKVAGVVKGGISKAAARVGIRRPTPKITGNVLRSASKSTTFAKSSGTSCLGTR